jgi:hypothetical protein
MPDARTRDGRGRGQFADGRKLKAESSTLNAERSKVKGKSASPLARFLDEGAATFTFDRKVKGKR